MSFNTNYLLAIEDLTVSFDGFKAVDSLNLYLDRNELRVIIGPNGAGKTTVLDMICGKTRATSGSVKFKNREMLGLPEHTIVRAGIGRKFQTPSIYENLTVYENLEVSFPRGRGVFGALFFKTTAEAEERIQKVAETTFLQDHLHTEGAFLSHGQKQWLEIGMLLMQEPELMMLDVHIAYRRACLNAIEYLKKFGYTGEQAYAILGTAPVEGHISGIVDIPNACATVFIPTEIFDFDITPCAAGPKKMIKGKADLAVCK